MAPDDDFTALAAMDPAFADALRAYGPPPVSPGPGRIQHDTRFAALARSIMGQQLSVASATAIHARLVELLGGEPTPENVLAKSVPALRACGLSGAKIRSLHGIAERVRDRAIDLESLDSVTEEQAEASLIGLPGVGPWTAHMFLMFVLGRPDVLAPGDVGVQNGIAKIFGLSPRPTAKELAEMGRAWAPHRTAACRLAWHVLDATPLGVAAAGTAAT